MVQPANAGSNRIQQLHNRAVEQLIKAHRNRKDESLILAVRYNLEQDDIYLLEVLDQFPGQDDEELLETTFEPSANLVILGKLHLALGSPGQLRMAVASNSSIVQAIGSSATVAFDDGSARADELKRALGL